MSAVIHSARKLDASGEVDGFWVQFEGGTIAATGTAPFNDGIHHTTAGYAVRNKAIAEALRGLSP